MISSKKCIVAISLLFAVTLVALVVGMEWGKFYGYQKAKTELMRG